METKKHFRKFLISLSIIIISLIFSGSVTAADFIVPISFDVPNVIALAAGVYPDYEGSDDDEFGALPALNLQWGHRYFRLLGTYAQLNIINNDVFRFGPIAFYRFGRGSEIDDVVVRNVHEVDASFEMGAFAGFRVVDESNIRINYGAALDFLQDVTDGHDGYTIQLSARGWYPVSKAIDLGLAGGWTYASDDYMASYFGVTSTDAANSALAFFDASGGSKDIYIQPMMVIHFSTSWHVGVGVRIKSLLGDAADSPVVDLQGDKTQVIGGIGVAYAW